MHSWHLFFLSSSCLHTLLASIAMIQTFFLIRGFYLVSAEVTPDETSIDAPSRQIGKHRLSRASHSSAARAAA